MAKNGDVTDPGKEWATELVRRIGAHAKTLRGTNSAQWLSDRTAELGMRISPSVIARLDSGHRGDVLSVPELFVLAAALDVAPLDLLAAGAPDGEVDLLPGRTVAVSELLDWVTGDRPLVPGAPPHSAHHPAGRASAITAFTRRLSATKRDLGSVSIGRLGENMTREMVVDYVATLRARARDLRESLRGLGADVRGGDDG